MSDYITDLAAEINGDPATLGYAGKTDAEVAAILNDATLRTVYVDVDVDVVGANIRSGDFEALGAGAREWIAMQLQGRQIPFTNSDMRADFATKFPSGSATRANLLAAAQKIVSRAQELGFPKVLTGHVTQAREL